MKPSQGVVSLLLDDVQKGSAEAASKLFPLVYGELHRLAVRYMARERPGNTLQATLLVDDAFLSLIKQEKVSWQGRAHFVGVAAKAIRQILVKHARDRGREIRGGKLRRLSLDKAIVFAPEKSISGLCSKDPLDLLEEALTRLETLDPRKVTVVELLYFGGLTQEEAGLVLGISSVTVGREWRTARIWLRREIERGTNR